MDFSLRCNSLKCRTQLTGQAVVTTCSHIFCVPCSELLGLAVASGRTRICPACETQLPNADDAVVTQLNPSEDYKTSIMSGLSPSVIMECAGRGLSFYAYQTAQEIVYQEFLAKSLTEKYNTLSSQMDNLVHDANNEIISLREKLKATQLEHQTLEKNNRDLVDALKQKSKSHAQLQHLYKSLKQQQIAGGIELAADHDAENAIHAAQHNVASRQIRQHGHSRAGSNTSDGGTGARQSHRAWEGQFHGVRGGLQSARSAAIPNTPLNHRSRLSLEQEGQNASRGVGYHGSTHRIPMQDLNPNVPGNPNHAGFGGIGVGVKYGRQQVGPAFRGGLGTSHSPGHGGFNFR